MSFTKVAPAGIGTEPGDGYRIGDSFLHSTGLNLGSGTTISHSGSATFTGIITAANISAASSVTATEFYGDGSNLDGVSSSGIGTALSEDELSSLNKIYYVNQELSIGSTVTVNHPDSAVTSYTHYQDLVVTDDADFIVADGDTFVPDVLGIRTSTSTASAATGGRIRAGTITNAGANGAPNFPNGLTGTAGTFTGNLNVGGVLTYEDVTNVDSVGVITARSGIRIGATGANTLITGNTAGIGIGTANPQCILDISKDVSGGVNSVDIRNHHPTGGASLRVKTQGTYGSPTYQAILGASDAGGTIRVGAVSNHPLLLLTNNTERLRIAESGQLGIGGANYGSSGQVLTSQGSGSAVQWASPSSPLTRSTNAGPLSGGANYDFTLPANCFKVEFVGHNISTSGSGTPAFRLGTSAGILQSGHYNFTMSGTGNSYRSSRNQIDPFDTNLNAGSDTGEIFMTFSSSSSSNMWIFHGMANRRTQTGNMFVMGVPDLGGNALTTIRFYPHGSHFDTGRFGWTAYTTS